MSYTGTEIKTSLRTARAAVDGLEQMVSERLDDDEYDSTKISYEKRRLAQWWEGADHIITAMQRVMSNIEFQGPSEEENDQ